MTKLLTVMVLTAAVWALAATASVSASRRSPNVVPGTYCGTTEQEQRLCLRTSARARAVVDFRSWSTVDCKTGAGASPVPFVIPLGVSGVAIPILRRRAFSLRQTKRIVNDQRRISNFALSSGSESFVAKGVFTPNGKVAGTLTVETVTFDMDGDHYQCAGNPVRWNAMRQG